MKIRQKIRRFALRLGIFCAAVGIAAASASARYPDRIYAAAGSPLSFGGDGSVWVSGAVDAGAAAGERSYTGTLMKGAVALKPVEVKILGDRTVLVSGEPFGIKLRVKGVLVVGLTDVDGKNGEINPARKAGIRPGDTILSANGTEVTSNTQLAELIESSGGKPVEMRLERDGRTLTVSVTPAFSVSEERYKSGVWIRDSTLGIGTMTFMTADGYYAGLGHAVADAQTGGILSVGSGELTAARISGVVRSQSGTPGELVGHILPAVRGNILLNGTQGLYGRLSGQTEIRGEVCEVAARQEVCVGAAEILCTLEGDTPQRYAIEIEKIFLNGQDEKNMVIRVTDPRLLETAGGVVQGMSGSPILQNGKLAGAVTHVFINAPTRGYAIFAENMLETARSVSALPELKQAS